MPKDMIVNDYRPGVRRGIPLVTRPAMAMDAARGARDGDEPSTVGSVLEALKKRMTAEELKNLAQAILGQDDPDGAMDAARRRQRSYDMSAAEREFNERFPGAARIKHL